MIHWTILGHFFAHHINIFHKIEAQIVIFIFLKHKLFRFLFFTTLQFFFLLNGPFMTIFGTFFRHYTNIFHKTIDQTIIVSCLMYLNLNWIKSQGVKYKLFQNQLFSNLKIYLINSHFMTIFGNF